MIDFARQPKCNCGPATCTVTMVEESTCDCECCQGVPEMNVTIGPAEGCCEWNGVKIVAIGLLPCCCEWHWGFCFATDDGKTLHISTWVPGTDEAARVACLILAEMKGLDIHEGCLVHYAVPKGAET
jgi:hypothetical protein